MAGPATRTSDRLIVSSIACTKACHARAVHNDALHGESAVAQHLCLLHQWVAKADGLLMRVSRGCMAATTSHSTQYAHSSLQGS